MEDDLIDTRDRLKWLALFGLAVVLRLILLGKFPLREVEAQWAYQAWELWQGKEPGPGIQAAYLSATRGLFALFGGSSTALARLWPALAGSLVIWIPYFLKRSLGRSGALIMGLGLAVDPGLVALSRGVGTPLPGVVFLLLAAGLFATQHWTWASLCAGLFLLSGQGLMMGLLILGGTLFLSQILDFGEGQGDLLLRGGSRVGTGSLPGVQMVLTFTGVILVIGTYLLSDVRGLTSWLGSIPAFFRGWTEPFPVSTGRILVALLAYQFFPLLFGVVGSIQAWRKEDRTGQMMSVWFLVGLVLILIYPGRQVWDLAWVLVPLWALASLPLTEMFRQKSASRASWILAGMILVLASLLWLSFARLTVPVESPRLELIQWGMVVGSFGLAVLSLVIVAAEWSWEEARLGGVMGLSAALVIYTLSALNMAAYRAADDPRQPWLPEPGPGQISLLVETIQEVSVYQTGREDSAPITLFVDTPSVLWALREFKNVSISPEGARNLSADIVVTGQERAESMQDAAYLGQDFDYRSFTDWTGPVPADWKGWIVSREGPVENFQLLLWVKLDAYPGGELFQDPGQNDF